MWCRDWDVKASASQGLSRRKSCPPRLWIVRLRQRGRLRMVTIGRVGDVEATGARSQARRLLAEVALDGLPTPERVKAASSRTDAREQPGGEFASPDPQARAQNAALQEPGLCLTFPLRPCLHIQHFLHPASSHHTTRHAAAPKRGPSDMGQRDSCRMNALGQIAPACDQHFNMTTP
jgi:hypothetical protein